MMRPGVVDRLRTPCATPGGMRTMREPHARALGLRALAYVEQDEQHPIGRRHVPDVGLALMEVERLDRAGLDLAVVDLAHFEALERLWVAAGQTRQLGHAPTVVGESLELDDLDTFDRRTGTVGLGLKGALGGGREVHEGSDLTAQIRRGAADTARTSYPSSAGRCGARRPR